MILPISALNVGPIQAIFLDPLQDSTYDRPRLHSEEDIISECGSDLALVPSPDNVIDYKTSVSPSEDMPSFAEQIIRMAKALELKHSTSEPKTNDPLMQALFTPDTGLVALPLLQGFQEVMFAAWGHPVSITPSARRLDGLYKIMDCASEIKLVYF
ncbi:UNVERIFIED_CONTAM: hypothetical protein K2H54_057429 [Gekko kuhli]